MKYLWLVVVDKTYTFFSSSSFRVGCQNSAKASDGVSQTTTQILNTKRHKWLLLNCVEPKTRSPLYFIHYKIFATLKSLT